MQKMEPPSSPIDAWCAAVAARDLEAVLAQYDEAALLLPTQSARVCWTPEERRAYFAAFLADLPGAPEVLWRQMLGPDVCVGLYRFGPKLVARFTLVLQDGKIVHHHSSAAPP